ncbi:MAG: DUF3365 domain-containing protein [Pseudomonadota bacterium]
MATTFSSRLQGELQAALGSGPAQDAIRVCRVVAPTTAKELTARRGWFVARTALRVRNPRNAPTLEERAVLLDFQRRAEAGEHLSAMEYAAVVDTAGVPYVHYMRAIPTKGVCLTCHGPAVAEAVTAEIRGTYPADAATGFQLGELRGAFTFVTPLREEAADDGED